MRLERDNKREGIHPLLVEHSRGSQGINEQESTSVEGPGQRLAHDSSRSFLDVETQKRRRERCAYPQVGLQLDQEDQSDQPSECVQMQQNDPNANPLDKINL